jgi:hypothetical protein
MLQTEFNAVTIVLLGSATSYQPNYVENRKGNRTLWQASSHRSSYSKCCLRQYVTGGSAPTPRPPIVGQFEF